MSAVFSLARVGSSERPFTTRDSSLSTHYFTYPFTTTDYGVTNTVHLTDAYGNEGAIATGRTIHFSGSDGAATNADSDGSALPGSNRYTYKNGDSGLYVFQVGFRTRGMQSLRVTDTLESTITATKADGQLSGFLHSGHQCLVHQAREDHERGVARLRVSDAKTVDERALLAQLRQGTGQGSSTAVHYRNLVRDLVYAAVLD